MRRNYIIHTETSALISYFENGYEYSIVVEGKETFLADQSPDEIVEKSFLHIGFNLDGAIQSARLHLNNQYKVPVALSAPKNIILIRCQSADKDSTVWLVNSHIQDIYRHQACQTTVYLAGGLSLHVDMKTKVLQDKRNQASFLHTTFLNRSHMNRTMTFLYEKDKGIMLVRENGNLNYTVKKKEEENLKK